MLTNERIDEIAGPADYWDRRVFARAVEAAATAPLLERIAGLERQLAQPCRHDLQAEGKHPTPCARFCEATAFRITIRGLERQLEQARSQMESQKNEWLSWESKRKHLERDATRWKTIAHMESKVVDTDIIADYIARPDRLDFIASVQPESAAIHAEVKP